MAGGSLRIAVTAAMAIGWATRVYAAPPRPERVRFVTEDGVVIVADYYAPKDDKAPLAILLHMYQRDRKTWRPLVPALHEAGFAVLAIDMRGHGQSTEPASMRLAERVQQRDRRLFADMDKDVAAAYAWVAREQADRVDLSRFAIVGASVGCSVAIDYASRDKSVDVVVCMTPGLRYLGINSERDIRRYGDRPILLLAAEDEKRAAEVLGKLAARATVTIVPRQGGPTGALHGTNMFGRVEDIDKRIVAFLLKHIGQPAEAPVVASIHSRVYHKPDSAYADRIKPANKRWFSSAAEAEARGLRASKR